ncbi:hypothetical protein Tco_1317992 [Tanacetum coccineum]
MFALGGRDTRARVSFLIKAPYSSSIARRQLRSFMAFLYDIRSMPIITRILVVCTKTDSSDHGWSYGGDSRNGLGLGGIGIGSVEDLESNKVRHGVEKGVEWSIVRCNGTSENNGLVKANVTKNDDCIGGKV